VSSYAPTLTSLLESHSKLRQNQTKTPKVLIVSQPNTPGQTPLPGTIDEAKVIQKYTSVENTLLLNGQDATLETVLQEMNNHNWVHLACHGFQNGNNALKSAFSLYDEQLKLELLVEKTFANAQLAFLSACQTATGDNTVMTEALHLAAGVLIAGFPSVFATMWSIRDFDAPIIADKAYEILFQHARVDSDDKKLSPAYALHEAVKHLKTQIGENAFYRWVPFIHIGA